MLLSSDEWSPGKIINGSLRIIGKLGKGGMGVVYRAEHMGMNEPRAIKVMRTDLTSDPQFASRFLQEAKTSGKLLHPNSVRLYDFAQAEDGKLFMVMEYVEGVSLRDLLSHRGPLPVSRAVNIVRQVADLLAAAHAQEIIHRDIKPDNIMLTRDSQGRDVIKVMDFGISSIRESGSGSNLTRPGMLVGTGPYASPEQFRGVRGRDLDGRCDIYSLGITFYEMLTGHLPFEAESGEDLARMVLSAPLPPMSPELGVPPAIEALVMRMTAKRPDDRPENAMALIRELNLADPAQGEDTAARAASAAGYGSGASEPTRVVATPPIVTGERTARAATPARPSGSRPRTGPRPSGPGVVRQTPVRAPAPVNLLEEPAHSRAPVVILSVLLVLALGAAGYFGYQWYLGQQLRQALAGSVDQQTRALSSVPGADAIQHSLALLQNRPMKVCNDTDSPVTIDRLVVVYRRSSDDQWVTVNNALYGYHQWTIPARQEKTLTLSGQGGNPDWDGSTIFYALGMPTASGEVIYGPDYGNIANGCLWRLSR
jgi:tRNA A-37 threonylcarbamoyl transferase component Bud32